MWCPDCCSHEGLHILMIFRGSHYWCPKCGKVRIDEVSKCKKMRKRIAEPSISARLKIDFSEKAVDLREKHFLDKFPCYKDCSRTMIHNQSAPSYTFPFSFRF